MAVGVAAGDQTSEQKKALAEIRAALSGRSLDELDDKVTKAKGMKGEAAFEDEVARLDLLVQYVKEFWNSVDKGARAALNAGELVVDGNPVAMVEFDRGVLVIRHEGQNKRYTRETLPAKLALVLAQQHLKPEVANNKVYFGAFLATDGKGDRRLAQQQWEAAAKGGADVKALLPELKAARAALPIALPELTPAHLALLNPAQWQRLAKNGGRVEKEALGKQARQTTEGRLVVDVSGAEEPVLIHSKKLAGDFQCRVFLQGVGPDRRFGLYPGTLTESPVVVALPEGTVKVEFMRKGGTFSCRINDEDVAVELPKKSAAKLAGHLGISLAEGRPLTIAAFEFAGR